MSFIADKIVMDGLTYDDVLLIPAYSEVLPKTVELTTKFSRNIELKVPFVTAAMDTVTEAKMAIAIAREGGIGVVHKNMSIEEQAKQVKTVKRAENGMILDPITLPEDALVEDALHIMREFSIGGIPVIQPETFWQKVVRFFRGLFGLGSAQETPTPIPGMEPTPTEVKPIIIPGGKG